MSNVVYLSKFWPRPLTPATVSITLEVEQDKGSDAAWTYHAKVAFVLGREVGLSGEIKAESRHHAEVAAMYKLVTLLGEELASEAARGDNMALELQRLRK